MLLTLGVYRFLAGTVVRLNVPNFAISTVFPLQSSLVIKEMISATALRHLYSGIPVRVCSLFASSVLFMSDRVILRRLCTQLNETRVKTLNFKVR